MEIMPVSPVLKMTQYHSFLLSWTTWSLSALWVAFIQAWLLWSLRSAPRHWFLPLFGLLLRSLWFFVTLNIRFKVVPFCFLKYMRSSRPLFWSRALFPLVIWAIVTMSLGFRSLTLLFSMHSWRILAASSEICPLFDLVCTPICSTKFKLNLVGKRFTAFMA